MESQKITFIAPFGLGQKTTVWARILPLARYLVTQKHHVTILIPPWDTPLDSGKTWTEDGVEIVHVNLGGGLPCILWRMIRYLHQTQPNIVHIIKPRAYAGFVQYYLWMRRKFMRRKFLRRKFLQYKSSPPKQSWYPQLFLDIDDWEQAWADINNYPPLVARFLAWQEEWGIRHADGITSASQWLTKRATNYAPETPILYLPNGIVDSGQLTVDSGELVVNGFTLLYFTRFVEVEAAWLADFWKAVQKILPQARLLVAGNALQAGREQVFQMAMADTIGEENGVQWLGFVSGEQLAETYKEADCAIFPSDKTPLLQAKCSVKLATTLLQGVPVVASAVGEQAAYGADGAALLVAVGATPEQFAQAAIELLQDKQQQQSICQKARVHLQKNYSWSGLGRRLDQFYADAPISHFNFV